MRPGVKDQVDEMFDVRFAEDGKNLEVKVRERRFDVEVSRRFRALLEEIWTPEVSNVVLDLEYVDRVDSAGAGALASVHKRIPSSNRTPTANGARGLDPTHQPLTLLNVSASVMTVIEVLRPPPRLPRRSRAKGERAQVVAPAPSTSPLPEAPKANTSRLTAKQVRLASPRAHSRAAQAFGPCASARIPSPRC